MYMLSCKMMGDKSDCNFEVKADTKGQAMMAMMQHAKRYHADMMDEMMMEKGKDDMKKMRVDMMKKKMVEA